MSDSPLSRQRKGLNSDVFADRSLLAKVSCAFVTSEDRELE